MVRVTVELVPASGGPTRLLGVAKICNDGEGTPDTGNYTIELSKFDGNGVWRRGKLEGFPRLRLGGWDLLFRALYAVVGFRNDVPPEDR